MGRPKLYKTDEERLTAGRQRSKRYYQRNREPIRKARKLKQEAAKAEIGKKDSKAPRRRAVQLTAEERKLKNKQKSQRYYERKKDEIKRRRQSGCGKESRNSSASASSGSYSPGRPNVWVEHLAYHVAQLPRALGNQSLYDFLEKLTVQFLKDGQTAIFDQEERRFDALLDRVQEFRIEILNKLGAGVRFDETTSLMSNIRRVIIHIQDLHTLALTEGWDGFADAYIAGGIVFHREGRTKQLVV